MGLDMHLMNVSLPLLDEGVLYELMVKKGRLVELRRQKRRLENSDFKPFSSVNTETLFQSTQQRFDLEGRILLPGFVDSHMHLDKAFSLPFVPNHSGTLGEAVRNYRDASPSFTQNAIKTRILHTALQALAFGTTAIRTHIDFPLDRGKEVAFRGLEAALEVKALLAPYVTLQVFPMCPFELTAKEVEMIEETILMGADGVGGAPHLSRTPREDLQHIFQLAVKYGKDIDLHTDEQDDPEVKTIGWIADYTEKHDYRGRVVVGHLCSLAAMDEPVAHHYIHRMKESGIGVVTLPAANMYLQGRQDRGLIRRGVTRIRELLEAGVQVATASDNIHDPFHPFGRGDLVQIGLLTGYAAHMGSPSEMLTLLKMMTEIPARLMGLQHYGLQVGSPAELVILDANSPEGIFTLLPEGRWVYKNGHWLSMSFRRQEWGKEELSSLDLFSRKIPSERKDGHV